MKEPFGGGYVFISGATGGIGKAFARVFAVRGDKLFLTGRSADKLAALKSELEREYIKDCGAGENARILTFPCDLTDEKSVKDMLAFIDGQGVKFSGIINVAGVDIQKPFVAYTPEKLSFQIKVNAESTLYITHALLSRREKGKMRIITISSMSGASPMPYFATYSATKAMLVNFFTALRYELKGQGVHVTTVMPGGVYTRPDVIADIKGQGLWGKLSAKSPRFVAEKSVKASDKNKMKYIPGFFNKFLYFVIKIAPERLVLRFIANRWKKQTKDAF